LIFYSKLIVQALWMALFFVCFDLVRLVLLVKSAPFLKVSSFHGVCSDAFDDAA